MGHFVKLNENFDKENVYNDLIEPYMEAELKKIGSIYVIYYPSCDCDYKQDVLLDRFPMSEKIISVCRFCKKASVFNITFPIRFYFPLDEREFGLEELNEAVITDTWQKPFLEAYKDENIHK